MSLAHHKVSLFPGTVLIGRLVQETREGETDSNTFSKEPSAGTSVIMVDRDCNKKGTGQGLLRLQG